MTKSESIDREFVVQQVEQFADISYNEKEVNISRFVFSFIEPYQTFLLQQLAGYGYSIIVK